jgi:hypothetical protein
MSKSEVIQVAGQAVAVAAPERGAYRFVAVKFEVWDLDGQVFETVRDAQRAAASLLSGARAFGDVEPLRVAHIAAYQARNEDRLVASG